MGGLVERIRVSAGWLLVAGALVASMIVAGGLLVGADRETLFADLLVDDALYYAVPASNWAAGEGFTFDGVHRTSGVQPLWGLIVTLMAVILGDLDALARFMVGASAVCWFLAGWLLFRAMRARSRWVAWCVAIGWTLAGLHDRLAFLGMENGLAALGIALVWTRALAGAEVVDAASGRRWLRRFGLTVGLFCLVRTEYGMLAPLIAIALGSGAIQLSSDDGRWRRFWEFTWPCALPILAWEAFAIGYFGALTPVSGSVKLFYESEWQPLHASWWSSLGWHLGHVGELAVPVVARRIEGVAAWLPGGGWTIGAVLVLAGFAALGRAPVIGTPVGRRSSWVLTLFGLLHLIVMGSLLPHFTEYGRWYFSVEVFVIWWWVGVVLLRLVERSRRWLAVVAVLTVGMIAGEFRTLWRPPARDANAEVFRIAGAWMNRALPDGRVIGSLSAGHVSATATDHRVINLDGLINSREYFEDYLSQHRMPEYLVREGVDAFADYQGLTTWKKGIRWRGLVPRESLELAWWTRMDGDRAYCVWRLPGASAAWADVFDAPSRVQFGAIVDGRWSVVTDPAEVPAGHRIVTSSASHPSGELRHVVVTEREAGELRLDRAHVWPRRAVDVAWGPVRLIGLDLPVRSIGRRRPLVVTLYWELGAEFVEPPPTEVALAMREIGSEGPWRSLRRGAPAHGTHPFARWQVGEVVTETYRFDLRRDDRGRAFELAVGVAGESSIVGGFTVSR